MLYLSWNFLSAWRHPLEVSNRPFIEGVLLLLLMETFAIFATLFTYSLVQVERRSRRALYVGGVCIPFGLLLYILGAGFERQDIGASIALVIAARGVSVLFASSTELGKFAGRWALGTFTLILTAAVISPMLPRLGMTVEAMKAIGAPVWVHQVVGLFALYYLLMALWEMLFAIWDLNTKPKMAPDG